MLTSTHPRADANTLIFLPANTIYQPTDIGVLFKRPGHITSIKGKHIYDAFSRIIDQLDGTSTLPEIIKRASPSDQPLLKRLLPALFNRHILISYDRTAFNLFTDKELSYLQPQLDFLHLLSSKPATILKRFCNATIILSGKGYALYAIAENLLRNGLKKLYLLNDVSTETIKNLHKLVASLQKENIICTLIEKHVEISKLDQTATIIHASDNICLSTILSLTQKASQHHVRFLPVMILGGYLRIGPLSKPYQKGCWNCALLRFLDQQTSVTRETLYSDILHKNISTLDDAHNLKTLLSLGGGTAAFELFREITEISDTFNTLGLLSISCTTLKTIWTPIIAHPFCPNCNKGNNSTKSHPQDQEKLSNTLLSDTDNSGLINAHFGIFSGFEDEHLSQAPIFTTCLRLSQTSIRGMPNIIRVTSCISNTMARTDALFIAAELYTKSLFFDTYSSAYLQKKDISPLHLSSLGAGDTLKIARTRAIISFFSNRLLEQNKHDSLNLLPLDKSVLSPPTQNLLNILEQTKHTLSLFHTREGPAYFVHTSCQLNGVSWSTSGLGTSLDKAASNAIAHAISIAFNTHSSNSEDYALLTNVTPIPLPQESQLSFTDVTPPDLRYVGLIVLHATK